MHVENSVKVVLKIETEVNIYRDSFLIKARPLCENSLVSVYITDGDVSVYIGKIETSSELFDLVGTENFRRTINDMATDYQWDSLNQALYNNDECYYIDGEMYEAKPYKED